MLVTCPRCKRSLSTADRDGPPAFCMYCGQKLRDGSGPPEPSGMLHALIIGRGVAGALAPQQQNIPSNGLAATLVAVVTGMSRRLHALLAETECLWGKQLIALLPNQRGAN